MSFDAILGVVIFALLAFAIVRLGFFRKRFAGEPLRAVMNHRSQPCKTLDFYPHSFLPP